MSLKERVVAKPLIPIALVAVIILLIIGICYQLNASNPPAKVTAPVVATTSAPAATLPASDVAAAPSSSAPAVNTPDSSVTPPLAAATAPTPASSPAASAPLVTNRATAEEELDRLSDEHARLVAQKADLKKQLEVSNKIVALKDKQIKQLESTTP